MQKSSVVLKYCNFLVIANLQGGVLNHVFYKWNIGPVGVIAIDNYFLVRVLNERGRCETTPKNGRVKVFGYLS